MAVVPANPTSGPASSTGIAPAGPMPPTPVSRLGEQVFDAVADIGDLAKFSALTIAWMFRRRPRWSVLVPEFLRDRRLQRPGRGDHRDVHRHGPRRPGVRASSR